MRSLFTSFLIIFGCCCYNAQLKDTLATENKKKFSSEQLIIPGSLMLTGVLINSRNEHSVKNHVKRWRNKNFRHFRSHIDDFLQFAPYSAVYGLEAFGMKPKNDLENRTAILIKSHIINLGMVYILKKSVADPRPDNTKLSFPSGHTAEAFAGATMVSMEYGEHYRWVPYAAFGTASLVGAMRIINNKHYLSDVLFGAGLGILSTKIAYWTHRYQWNKPEHTIDDDPFDTVIYNKP